MYAEFIVLEILQIIIVILVVLNVSTIDYYIIYQILEDMRIKTNIFKELEINMEKILLI